MSEKIISVDYETKQEMKKIIDCVDYAVNEDTCNYQCLDEALVSLTEIKKRMRVFVKPKKDSKTFSIRINSEESKESITDKLNRITKKIYEYNKLS